MSLVHAAPVLRYVDGDTWCLMEPFAVYSDVAVGRITVPAGCTTDFNSVPRLLTNILPKEHYGEAGILHDYLYCAGKLHGVAIDRLLADQVHREFVIWKGAPAWKVSAFYRGLRAFGWWAWRKHRRKEATRG